MTPDQEEVFRQHAAEFMTGVEELIPEDPLNILSTTFNKLYGLALAVFPQEKKLKYKRLPGWNRFVKEIQKECERIETLWNYSGRTPHSPLSRELTKVKMRRKLAIDQAKQNIRESIALAMADDMSASTHFDRSRSWTPVRAVIKGKSTDCSSIIENHRKTNDILKFWQKHYADKLNASSGPLPTSPDSTAFKELAEETSDDIFISVEDSMYALRAMNYSAAYYDDAGPKLLELCNTQFCTLFTLSFNTFINASLTHQKYYLRDSNNFLISYIKPIPKASDANPTLAKSDRPISVSHTLTILFERVMVLRNTPASLNTDMKIFTATLAADLVTWQ